MTERIHSATDLLDLLAEVARIPLPSDLPGPWRDDFLLRLVLWDAERFPFDARSFDAAPRGSATVAEANPDALRLWVMPMARGERYSAVIPWPEPEEADETPDDP